MGELRTIFNAMKKEREERRKSLEPSRVQLITREQCISITKMTGKITL